MPGIQVELNKWALLISIRCSKGWPSMSLCVFDKVKLELRSLAQAKQGYSPLPPIFFLIFYFKPSATEFALISFSCCYFFIFVCLLL